MPNIRTSEAAEDNNVTRDEACVWPPAIAEIVSVQTVRLEGIILTRDPDTLTLNMIGDRLSFAIFGSIVGLIVTPLSFHTLFQPLHYYQTLYIHGTLLSHGDLQTLMWKLIGVYAVSALIGWLCYNKYSGRCRMIFHKKIRLCIAGSGMMCDFDRVESVKIIIQTRIFRPRLYRVNFHFHGDKKSDTTYSLSWPHYLGSYVDSYNAASAAKIIADFVGVPVSRL